jgi:endo-1,4-beta-mannosidase
MTGLTGFRRHSAPVGRARITTPPTSGATMPRLTKTAAGMIQRSGVNWRVGGFNVFHLAVNDYGGTPHIMSHAEIDSLLDKCVTMGAYYVRAHTLGIGIGDQSYHLVAGVSGTTTPVISYRPAVWEAIDYAIAGCASRGLYLCIPMTDELGYYHGGRRQWVNFRRPGTCSTSFDVKAANSPAERAAEGYFYTDSQIRADFKQYVSDWLLHVNQYTGRANRDEPAVAFIETGNELWTSVQDAPTWAADLCQYIKGIAPLVLTAEGGGTDGQSLNPTSLASPYVDVFSTHPYTTYGPSDVTTQAIQAAQSGKAYMVGEYPWSKAAAPNIEAAARAAGNVFTTAPWSLQNDADLHNNGAAYGTDDVSLYVPGKDSTQVAAVARLKAHAQSMRDSAASATPAQAAADTTQSGISDTFTGTDGAAPDTSKWNVYASTGSTATIQGNTLRIVTGTAGGYGDKVAVTSKASARVDQRVVLDVVPGSLSEAYFQVSIRSNASDGSIGDVPGYRMEIATATGTVSIVRRGANPVTIGSSATIAGWAAGTVVHLDFSAIGSTISLYAWTGSTKPSTPTIMGTNTDVTTPGYTGIVLNGGNPTTSVTMTVDTFALTNTAPAVTSPTVALAGFAIPGTHLAYEVDQAGLTREMTAVSGAGSKMVRFDVSGVQIEATQGVRDWSNLDRIVAAAQAAGLSMVGIITTLPAWSASSWQVGPTTTAQRNAYVSFAQAAVTRYAGKVTTWEVWNEPNNATFWISPDVAAYTALLKVAYPAIKAIAPTATVLTGGTAGGQSGGNATEAWHTGLYSNGAKGYFDAVAVHPYPDSYAAGVTSGEMSHIAGVRSTMAANGDSAVPMWATEVGFPTGGGNSVTDAQQGTFIPALLNQWATATGTQRGPALIHSLRDQLSQADREAYFGVIRDTWTGKPAYDSVAAFNNATRANLVTDPTVDYSGSWFGTYGTGSSVVRSTDRAYTGTTSMKGTFGASYCFLHPLDFTVVPSTAYTVAAWVYTPINRIRLIMRGDGGYQYVDAPTTPNVWTLVTWTFTTAAGQTTGNVDFGFEQDTSVYPVGTSFYVDAAVIQRGVIVTPIL